MPTELDYIGPTEDCPHPELWHNYDAAASEVEVGDFLWGLTKILKPDIVIETGCYLGYTSKRIGEALFSNGKGCLFTCDTNPAYVEEAIWRVYPLPVKVTQNAGWQLIDRNPGVDLAFLDSGGDRLQEAKALKLAYHGVVVLHDSRHADYRTFAEETGWREIFFPTPRGISIFKQEGYCHACKT